MSFFAKAAAKALSERTVIPPVDDRASRDAGIAAIQRAMAERAARQRRSKRLVVGAFGVVAAAAAVAAVFVHRAPASATTLVAQTKPLADTAIVVTATSADPEVTIERSGATREALTSSAAVQMGSHIVAPPGAHAMLGFSTGTSLTLDGSDVTVIDARATQKLELRDGAISAKVAHLTPGRRFLVSTPDAEVEVRGTTFRVGVVPPADACADGTRTRVVVTEGVVVVRSNGREDRVEAGGSWPSTCAKSPASATTSSSHPTAPLTTAAALSASSLSAQNDLFADAMTAKRSGDKGRAIGTLDDLVTKYPHGPLRESAEAERLRLLRDENPARAAVEARAYLARYPKGFARDEAQAILTP